MELAHVGMQRSEWKGCGDGYSMEYSPTEGLLFCAFFQNPRESEKMEFKALNDFEIRFTDFDGIGFFSVKIGNLPWGDCAFTPNLYNCPPVFPEPEEGKGLALNLLFVDSATGILQSIRVIGLGKEFTAHFVEWCKESLRHNISRKYYDRVVKQVYQNHTPEELSRKMMYTYKVPHREDRERG